MKHLMLIAAIMTSVSALFGMETQSAYEKMLCDVSNAAQGKPSITLISNDLPLEVSAQNNCKKTSICLRVGTQLKLSPYGHPFLFDEKQKKFGAILQLHILADKQHDLNLSIGGNSTIRFGDSISIDHDEDNCRIYIIHNNKKVVQTLHTGAEPIDIGLFQAIKSSKKDSFLKKFNSLS